MKTVQGDVRPPEWFVDVSGLVYHRLNPREILVTHDIGNGQTQKVKQWEYEEEYFSLEEYNAMDLPQQAVDNYTLQLIEKGVL
ncbi:MAG: hypothetical protein RR107_01985 [Clostridia bacterium]